MALDRDDFASVRRTVTHEESLAAAAELKALVAVQAKKLNITTSMVDELLAERRADSSFD
ncbi:MAG: hypothetical protein RL486_1036 [Actinomycetota bacterium]|jgi:hypothetical protein